MNGYESFIYYYYYFWYYYDDYYFCCDFCDNLLIHWFVHITATARQLKFPLVLFLPTKIFISLLPTCFAPQFQIFHGLASYLMDGVKKSSLGWAVLAAEK